MQLTYYDRQGRPLELLEWVKLLEDLDYIHVGLTLFGPEGPYDLPGHERLRKRVPDVVEVSTVWMGIDHRGFIFESMVFSGPHDEFQWRYATEAQALAGHQRIVEALKAGRAPEHDDDLCASP